MKRLCHPKLKIKLPPNIGDNAIPMYTAATAIPRAGPFFSLGIASTINAMDETFSKAEPIPNTTLNSSNIDAFNDKAVPKVPIRKNIIPTFNILFKPYF